MQWSFGVRTGKRFGQRIKGYSGFLGGESRCVRVCRCRIGEQLGGVPLYFDTAARRDEKFDSK